MSNFILTHSLGLHFNTEEGKMTTEEKKVIGGEDNIQQLLLQGCGTVRQKLFPVFRHK